MQSWLNRLNVHCTFCSQCSGSGPLNCLVNPGEFPNTVFSIAVYSTDVHRSIVMMMQKCLTLAEWLGVCFVEIELLLGWYSLLRQPCPATCQLFTFKSSKVFLFDMDADTEVASVKSGDEDRVSDVPSAVSSNEGMLLVPEVIDMDAIDTEDRSDPTPMAVATAPVAPSAAELDTPVPPGADSTPVSFYSKFNSLNFRTTFELFSLFDFNTLPSILTATLSSAL